MPTTSNRQASIDSRRIALEREITIRVPRFDTFVTEYSSNISTTGMFIVSDKPQAPGTTFAFEFSVADDWKLIRGKAQVVWTRYRDEGGERQAGMGVRFVELDAQSRRLIRWIVEKHIREGGKPFELDELRNVIDEALEEVVETDEALTAAATGNPGAAPTQSRRPVATRPQPVRSTSDRNIAPLVATAAAIVVGLVFLFWLTEWLPARRAAGETVAAASQPESTAAEAPENGSSSPSNADRPAGDAGAQTAAATGNDRGNGAAPSDPVPRATGTSSPPVGSAYAGVRQALAAWSAAWSEQNVDGYLAAYSRDFEPQGATRSAWQALRRERLTAPEYIKVSITQLDIQRVRDNLVQATFFQSYRSDRFSDTVNKKLELVWEDGDWKIWREGAR